MEFTHLHVHSHYSLLDGGNRISDLVSTATAHGMTSLALTDHGNLFGAIDFYNQARKSGLKPILGMEAYIAPGSRLEKKSVAGISDASYHLLLLAMNETGWRNLMRLSSRAFLEGYYYKPRLDRELLSEFSEGLVCTSACLGGEIPQALLHDKEAEAHRIAGEYLDIFGPDRFFIEIQNQGVKDQDRVNPLLIELARKLGVGLVGTNDVHFLRRSDKRSHEVLTCISTGRKLNDEDQLEYSNELYLKSPTEMGEVFSAWPEAIRNTLRIAEMCDLKLDLSQKHLPVFSTPDGTSPSEFLRQAAWKGLANRFGEVEPPPEYRTRLEWELKVIEDKGYSSYFLIVNDFVQFARQHDIPAAPRGSGVATLLGYALGIANVDPLRYGLLFERFTDPQRQEDPDVDVDICQEGRERVVQYVREKYGHVAQIITYGTLKARAVLRDVGRVLNVPLDEVNRIIKLVPDDPKTTLDKALNDNPDFRRLYEDASQPHVREMVEHGRILEGLARHTSVHAAGVVVCDEPLEALVPLCRIKESPEPITQWDGPTCEKAGMMKMDLLGLKTLTVIQRAREMVRAKTGKDLDPCSLALDDQKVFALFRNGETDGVFQFESEGMKGVLQNMQPNRIEDLIAANAMYRPGPMELISTYCLRKRGERPVENVHPRVDDILAETYGIMIYQEQVMQVLNRLGDIPLSRALTLIKAISKKKKEVIDSERPAFIEGAGGHGIDKAEAERLFDLILKFAGYGFNKAHSTQYAITAYQTAYFKAHHPLEFWAATLTYEADDQDKLVLYMKTARQSGIEVAPPDINACNRAFSVDGKRIRFGLMAVKGVGGAAVDVILAARAKSGPFKNLYHFCRSVDLRSVNRSTIEALVKCGAFESVAGRAHRGQLVAAIEAAMQSGHAAARDRDSGQMSLFGGVAETSVAAPETYPETKPWTRDEILIAEKETLGFYVSEHPLEIRAAEIRGLNWPRGFQLDRIAAVPPGKPVAVCGMVTGLRQIVVKQGKSAGERMAGFVLEDLSGRCEAVLFSGEYSQFGPLLQNDALLYFVGTPDTSRDRLNLIIHQILPLAEAAAVVGTDIQLDLPPPVWTDAERMRQIKQLLVDAKRGNAPVRIRLTSEDHEPAAFEIDRALRVRIESELLTALRSSLGERCVTVLGREPPARAERRGFRRGNGVGRNGSGNSYS
ncbi:MAG: DNA polymerase III subunit alpha [Kiritimatiellia bacterium]|nr:DNA polymerase III subunit alpha [Kiritimatiellia bacterium]